MMFLLVILVCFEVLNVVRPLQTTLKFSNYEIQRNSILAAENHLITGSEIRLNDKEILVNKLFMKYKQEELLRGAQDESNNAPSMHFFKAKELIESSPIFKFLKLMPKGATLHLHTTASVSSKWIVDHISYKSKLLRCKDKTGLTILTFRTTPVCVSKYVNVDEERAKTRNPPLYDKLFERLINLWKPEPEIYYPTSQVVWKKFQNMFSTLHDVIRYLPVYREYINRMLEELYEDNVMYAELRMNFNDFYDDGGKTVSPERAVDVFLDVLQQFMKNHKNFIGVKIIYCTFRQNENYILEQIDIFEALHKQYPHFVVGFDLVGQEDKGQSLFKLRQIFTNFTIPAKLFLHAGETNFYGSSTDINLLDAILLNTARIGHGYALMKHPLLYDMVKKRNIAIEVSPISNQVLHLVSDLRNHPASLFIAHNIPFVICNDDPGLWNAKGLTYDYYYAIMSIAPNYGGLRILKALVWNSIHYAMLNDYERYSAFRNLNRDWDNFIDKASKDQIF